MTIRQPTNTATSPAMPLALSLALAFTTSAAACAPADDAGDDPAGESEEAMTQRAREIHDRVVTLDTHIDISTSNFTAERNYTTDLPTQVTLPKMEAGGLDVGWFVVYTSQGLLNDEGYATAYENAVDKFDAIHRMVNEYAPDRIELALTSDDVRRIATSGRLVAMIGVENAYPLGTDISRVEEFHERGARYMSLAHTGPNQLSDAHSGENDGDFLHGGLSEMGREAVAEMNRLGIMIDISHPSKPSIMQTLEMTRAPVMASHSSARGLSDVSRNLDDEQLHAVAANGGVVQTVALRSFVNTTRNAAHREAMDAIEAEVAAEMGVEILGRGGMFALPPTNATPTSSRCPRSGPRQRSGRPIWTSPRRQRGRFRRPDRLHGQPHRPRARRHQLGLRWRRRRGGLGRRVGNLQRHAGAGPARLHRRGNRHALERQPLARSRRSAGRGSDDSGRRRVGRE